MTNYEPLPPEREQAFLQNAELAINEAIEPVVLELGTQAVLNAEAATKGAATLGDSAEQFAWRNDIHADFMDTMEAPREPGIADEAALYLGALTAYKDKKQGIEAKYGRFVEQNTPEDDDKGALEMKLLREISTGDDKEIRRQMEKPTPPPEDTPEV